MTSKQTVLSYYNTLITHADMRLLDEGQWLNDNLIGLYFEYLEHEVLRDESVLLVGPDVSYLVSFSDAREAQAILQTLDIGSRQLILLPINNNSSVNAAGGSHWSLLVASVEQRAFYHYDSCRDINSSPAKRLAKAVQKTLGWPDPVEFTAVPCPQQANSYDCGMHVICMAGHLCELVASRGWKSFGPIAGDMSESAPQSCMPSAVSLRRQEYRELILRLAQQGPHG